MTPSKGDSDHAVNLSGVHGMCRYLCVFDMHVCTYVYVSRKPNIGVMQSHLIPYTIVCVATPNLSGKKD